MNLRWSGLITERDNETPCFVRLLTLIGVIGFIAITLRASFSGQAIGYSEWAVGFTTIVAGGAGAARLKLQTEGKEE